MRMVSRMKALAWATVLGGALFSAQPASAALIMGGTLDYAGGEVTVTTLPVSSGYTSELGLYDSSFTLVRFLALDEPAGVSVTFDPSDDGFGVGDELIFGIRVLNTGDTFFMGPASRNADNVIHNRVITDFDAGVYGIGTYVGFEDLFGGGDQDFDDNAFLFTGGITAVPEPVTIVLLGIGLGAARLTRRRRA